MKYLIIIESPSKAKKIKSILEKKYPEHIFNIIATVGHILNLPKTSLGIDLKKYTGKFQVLPDKKKIIKNIIAAAKIHDNILIATDNDNEGEAIGFDVMNILNMNYEIKNRMIFNEITEYGLVSAFNNLTYINLDKVNAQRGRRLIDRLVGFKLSSLTKKFFNNKEITAGRVLSVTTKLLCEENKKFLKSYNTKLCLYLHFQNYILPFSKIILEETEILKILNKYKNNQPLNISFVKCTEKKESPPLPFITSSLMSNSPYSAHETSKILQSLYQGGHITYIRTDSYNISNTFKQEIAKHININKGSNFLNNEKIENNLENTRAHECIRPVNMFKILKLKNPQSNTIYNMIFKRTLQYLMTDYIYDSYMFKINIPDDEDYFILKINNTKHLGFKEKIEDNLQEINKFKTLKHINYDSIYSSYEFSRLKLLSEGSLITRLKKLNIGKPSTYSHIINNMKNKKYIQIKNIPEEKIKKNYYVLKNDNIFTEKKNFIIPEQLKKIIITDRGENVTNFLENNFSKIINYDYSSELEKYLDLIEKQEKTPEEVIKLFYTEFKDKIEELKKELKKDKVISEYKYDDYDIFKNIRIKNTRYGWKIITNIHNKDYYLNIDSEIISNIKNIVLDDIKKYLPIVQYHENNPIILLDGHDNGKYIKYMSKNIPLPKNIKYKNDIFFKNINLINYIKK